MTLVLMSRFLFFLVSPLFCPSSGISNVEKILRQRRCLRRWRWEVVEAYARTLPIYRCWAPLCEVVFVRRRASSGFSRIPGRAQTAHPPFGSTHTRCVCTCCLRNIIITDWWMDGFEPWVIMRDRALLCIDIDCWLTQTTLTLLHFFFRWILFFCRKHCWCLLLCHTNVMVQQWTVYATLIIILIIMNMIMINCQHKGK